MAAAPMGRPGWPELACWTASAARKRIVLTHVSSSRAPSISRLRTSRWPHHTPWPGPGKGSAGCKPPAEGIGLGPAMGYVDKHLGPGERVIFRTRLHPVLFNGAARFSAFVVLVVTLVIRHNDLSRQATVHLVLGGIAVILASFVTPFARWRTSEFAVTDRRVLIKVGLLSVHTVELLLQKVEAIGVDQTFIGRLLTTGRCGSRGPAAPSRRSRSCAPRSRCATPCWPRPRARRPARAEPAQRRASTPPARG